MATFVVSRENNCSEMNAVLYDDNLIMVYKDMVVSLMPDFVTSIAVGFEYNPLVFAVIGSILVGLSGIFPLLVIPIDSGASLKHGAGAKTLKVLLSFAVGGLLGDVFLHLLPEAWANDIKNAGDSKHPSMFSGIMLLSGMLVFIVIEKIFSSLTGTESEFETVEPTSFVKDNINNNTKGIDNHLEPFHVNGYKKELINCSTNGRPTNGFKKNGITKNGVVNSTVTTNGYVKQPITIPTEEHVASKRQVTGYLNLLANCIDNFTHGLAVGGSFLISLRLGFLTTFAILVHEIPHEVGDFAILLRAGFSRWDAAKGQLFTAFGGLFGAIVAVASSGKVDETGQTSWILPFTAGGFLYIALVTVLPDLLKEENSKESAKQFGALVFGIIVMATLTIIVE